MKKLLMLGVAVSLFSVPAAFAGHGEDHDGTHHKGKMFEKLDSDADGVVTREEFMDAHGKMFEKIDTDADGRITKAEIEAKREEWRAKMKEHKEDAAAGETPVDDVPEDGAAAE